MCALKGKIRIRRIRSGGCAKQGNTLDPTGKSQGYHLIVLSSPTYDNDDEGESFFLFCFREPELIEGCIRGMGVVAPANYGSMNH
jgi:hypothetical protein